MRALRIRGDNASNSTSCKNSKITERYENASVMPSAFVILVITPLPTPLLVPVRFVLLLLVLPLFPTMPAAMLPVALLSFSVRPSFPIPDPVPVPVPIPIPAGLPVRASVLVSTAIPAFPPVISVPPVVHVAPASIMRRPAGTAILVAPGPCPVSPWAGFCRIALQQQIITAPAGSTGCINPRAVSSFCFVVFQREEKHRQKAV